MRCIYCLERTTGAEGEAHVIPEAIMKNDGVLPRGSVCNSCNNYLGQLDVALCAHPLISLAIQSFGLPGKKGKARAKLGNVDRKVDPYGITIPCAEPEPIFDDAGRRIGFSVTPLFDKTFDFSKFRRALHHVGFNLTASLKGVHAMYASTYDQARNYVRFPKKGESWPFGQYVVSLEDIDKVMFGGLFQSEVDEYVGLRLFQVAFFVDLMNSGGLKRFLDTEQPAGTDFIDTDFTPPRIEKDKRVQYSFTIILDESDPDAP